MNDQEQMGDQYPKWIAHKASLMSSESLKSIREQCEKSEDVQRIWQSGLFQTIDSNNLKAVHPSPMLAIMDNMN
jgi:hypothetical protein